LTPKIGGAEVCRSEPQKCGAALGWQLRFGGPAHDSTSTHTLIPAQAAILGRFSEIGRRTLWCCMNPMVRILWRTFGNRSRHVPFETKSRSRTWSLATARRWAWSSRIA